MKKEITLPKISESDEKGMVAEVYVSEGDQVSSEDAILAVESDKATVDIPVEEGGTILELKVKEGDEVASGDLLLILETDAGEKDEPADDKDEEERQEVSQAARKDEDEEQAESKPARADEDDGGKDKKEEKTGKEAKDSTGDSGEDDEKKKEKKELKEEKDQQSGKPEKSATQAKQENKEDKDDDRDGSGSGRQAASETTDPEIRATPLVREMARELGVGMREILKNRKGPEMQITRDDLFDYVKERMKGNKGISADPSLPDFSQWGDTSRETLSPVRRKVAEVTRQAWTTIPHVTNHEYADVSDMNGHLEKLEGDPKITLTAVVIKILAEALIKFPRFNSSLDAAKQELVLKEYVNIAVAVDTDSGLFMPVIRKADQKSLTRLAEDLRDLAGKARDQKLAKEDMEGGNFALSNLGGIGGALFTPVIFPPHVAILGLSRMKKEARWTGSEFEPRDILPLSLSYDHRVIDGADAARFLDFVRKALENPLKLIS